MVPLDDEEADNSGEIVAKAPAIMLGYLNKPEETKAYFTEDGFAKTGDLGTVDSDGCIKFISRLHSLFR